MPISDLSAVTTTIINLVKGVLARDLPTQTVEVSAVPPERESASNPTKAVSVHLLHVMESAEYRNRDPGPRKREIQIQQIPLGLILHYVISVARSQETDEGVALDLHEILGVLARGFHDYPVITPNTKFTATELPPDGQVLDDPLLDENENLDLILKPATLEENLNFWATQDAKLARACLFVEARVAVMRPQRPTIAPGIVLSVGNFVFPSAAPQLVSSTNQVLFRPPGSTEPVSITAAPGRVALLEDTAAPFPSGDEAFVANSRLTISGSGFHPGHHFLVLKRDDLKISIDLDSAPAVVNPNWALLVGPSEIHFSFRERVVAVVDDQGPAELVRLVPGIYSARLVVQDPRLPGGARPRSSNLLAFSVTPQIRTLVPTIGGSGDAYLLQVSGPYLQPLSTPPAERKLEIELGIAGLALTEVGPLATLAEGQFQITAADSDTLRFRLPSATPALAPSDSNPLPVLLVVNGTAAPPRWLVEAGGPP
jgi:hypothetical protein